MRFVRGEAERDIQLEGRIVRIDATDAASQILRFDSVEAAVDEDRAQRERALTEGFVEAPDPVTDHDARIVYADELQLRGDPLGEFVAISYELAMPGIDPKQRKRAEHRMTALLDEHHERWFGELERYVRKPTRKSPAHPPIRVHWHLGFAEAVEVQGTRAMPADGAYQLLRRLPLSRQIRRLVIGTSDPDDAAQYGNHRGALPAMLAYGIPSRLHELVVGQVLPHLRPLLVLDGLVDVVEAARSLEILRVVGGHGSYALVSESLRTLEIRDVLTDDLDTLALATLPNLTELVLRARAPIAAPGFLERFAVRHLTLERFGRFDTERSLLDQLAGVIGSLRTFALPRCELDDRELVTIIREPHRFAHLTRLDLRHNRFSRHLARTAKRALPSLRLV